MVALHFFSDFATIVADCGCQLFTSIYSHSTSASESAVLFPLVTHSGLQVSSSLLFAQYHSWLLTVDSRVIQSPYSMVIPLPEAFCTYQCVGGVTNGEETALEGVCFMISRQILMHHYGLDMHIQWCKAQAKAKRWFEEVELLLEEMWRTLLFFQWDVTHWEERRDLTAAIDEDMLEGHLAYAQRQAHIRNHLAKNCHCSWSPTMEIVKKLDCKHPYEQDGEAGFQ